LGKTIESESGRCFADRAEFWTSDVGSSRHVGDYGLWSPDFSVSLWLHCINHAMSSDEQTGVGDFLSLLTSAGSGAVVSTRV
jgi:hypothetical protein